MSRSFEAMHNEYLNPPDAEEPAPTFVKELEKLINKRCMENGSNTPDFILAEYLTGCLSAFDAATKARDRWNTAAPDGLTKAQSHQALQHAEKIAPAFAKVMQAIEPRLVKEIEESEARGEKIEKKTIWPKFPGELNAAVAEACGWRPYPKDHDKLHWCHPSVDGCVERLPDYTKSRDKMGEVIKRIPHEKIMKFARVLADIVHEESGPYGIATAEQEAMALAITMDLEW